MLARLFWGCMYAVPWWQCLHTSQGSYIHTYTLDSHLWRWEILSRSFEQLPHFRTRGTQWLNDPDSFKDIEWLPVVRGKTALPRLCEVCKPVVGSGSCSAWSVWSGTNYSLETWPVYIPPKALLIDSHLDIAEDFGLGSSSLTNMFAVRLPGQQGAACKVLISSASPRRRPKSKWCSTKHGFLLCKVSVRIANSLFWNAIGESFCGMWGFVGGGLGAREWYWRLVSGKTSCFWNIYSLSSEALRGFWYKKLAECGL